MDQKGQITKAKKLSEKQLQATIEELKKALRKHIGDEQVLYIERLLAEKDLSFQANFMKSIALKVRLDKVATDDEEISEEFIEMLFNKQLQIEITEISEKIYNNTPQATFGWITSQTHGYSLEKRYLLLQGLWNYINLSSNFDSNDIYNEFNRLLLKLNRPHENQSGQAYQKRANN